MRNSWMTLQEYRSGVHNHACLEISLDLAAYYSRQCQEEKSLQILKEVLEIKKQRQNLEEASLESEGLVCMGLAGLGFELIADCLI